MASGQNGKINIPKIHGDVSFTMKDLKESMTKLDLQFLSELQQEIPIVDWDPVMDPTPRKHWWGVNTPWKNPFMIDPPPIPIPKIISTSFVIDGTLYEDVVRLLDIRREEPKMHFADLLLREVRVRDHLDMSPMERVPFKQFTSSIRLEFVLNMESLHHVLLGFVEFLERTQDTKSTHEILYIYKNHGKEADVAIDRGLFQYEHGSGNFQVFTDECQLIDSENLILG